MTYQDEFGGAWTQQKLQALTKYLAAYTKLFKKNPRAKYYSISYVDAFAGTGTIPRRKLSLFTSLIPELDEYEEEYRKGSVKRALEIEPPFDEYVFIEKSAKKCRELSEIATKWKARNIKVVNDDANTALLEWCKGFDSRRQRAVVFLDPFGASVRWEVIAALGRTRAVDLWILFPYSAINRMLARDHKPTKSWSRRLTAVFGTSDWENLFYSKSKFQSVLNSDESIEAVYKSADHREIIGFFVNRLRQEFKAVSEPLPLYNSKNLQFILFFAATNERSAETGLKITNYIIGQ